MRKKKQKNLRLHIEELQGKLCDVVDMYLSELSSREKLENAPINQIASALGVLIEKFTKNSADSGDNGMLEELISELKNNDSSS